MSRIRRVVQLLILLSLLLMGMISQAQTEIPVPDEMVRWDGESAFNLLILGVDQRPAQRMALRNRTDAIFIARFDPQNGRVGILHIPRDLHVAIIDDLDNDILLRVNTLVVRGENRQAGYGAYYALDTLQYNFGIYLDGFIVFDFIAFEAFIDAIGGVTVDVPYTINDPTYPDMNYGYDPFYLPSGTHTLDGYDALRFARTRHQDNDYIRGERQLQVIRGVQERLSDPLVLTQLVREAPQLYSDLFYHVHSNITPENLLFLGLEMMKIDDLEVVTGSVNTTYSLRYNNAGVDIQVINSELLPLLMSDVFGHDYWR